MQKKTVTETPATTKRDSSLRKSTASQERGGEKKHGLTSLGMTIIKESQTVLGEYKNLLLKAKRRTAPSRSARRFSFVLRASNLLSPVDVPLVPLPSATPFGQAIWHFEQPIVLADRGTPRQRQSRRLASVGSRPLGPRNETLRNAN